jgi:hypothetical protein
VYTKIKELVIQCHKKRRAVAGFSPCDGGGRYYTLPDGKLDVAQIRCVDANKGSCYHTDCALHPRCRGGYVTYPANYRLLA